MPPRPGSLSPEACTELPPAEDVALGRTSKTVDEYLADVPGGQRAVLEALRKTIRSAVPGAEERISYGIPIFVLSKR